MSVLYKYIRLLVQRLLWGGKSDYSFNYYSQDGEDVVLRRIFETVVDGIYVDVGSHHPMRFSNTYLFYRRGWRGINIDPRPNSKRLFDRYRPHDINLEVGICKHACVIDYYMFGESALNTFSVDRYNQLIQSKITKFKGIRKIECFPLSLILDQNLQGRQIGFLSIDVEGLDLDVLQSNNWEKYKPKVILIEQIYGDVLSLKNTEILKYLYDLNYILVCKVYNTSVFSLQWQ